MAEALQHPRTLIKQIESQLSRTLLFDRHAIRRQIKRLKSPHPPDQKTHEKLLRLKKRLDASIRKRSWRKANQPEPAYNDALPITSRKDDIVEAIRNHPVLIISGETGSGKSTQIPKFCLAAGRGINGMIGCTQPRRIAATTVSRRIAEEMGEELGRSVGYKIRFTDRTHPSSFIKVMTDGILLAETQADPYLTHYDTLIIDEAHERSLNIDFILGILRRLVKRRRDLKLIVTSATIDTEKFSKAFDDAPIIEVSGRMYPVEVRYDSAAEEGTDLSHIDMAVDAVEALQRETLRGDILVFMPTEQDIRETCVVLEGRDYPKTTVLPLFARLTGADQQRVFSRPTGRKIIVATNVAETSITIPGIKYVIDTGLARISRYSPRTRTTSLPVSPVSKSSADQRKGRCGRVENGVCIRLFPEDDYETRPQFTPPEILRSNLAEVILRMIALTLGNINEFPFIDSPQPKSIQDGVDLLFELGAITAKQRRKKADQTSPYALTARGRTMAKLPVDPRLSRMLIQAQQERCLEEMMIIAAALSVPDPRERPSEKTAEADQAHKIFDDANSDFITLLNLWKRYHETLQTEKPNAGLRRFCRKHFLSYMRMREWRDIHRQINTILSEAGMLPIHRKKRTKAENGDAAAVRYRGIHRSVLSGFLSNIAEKKEQNIYKAAKGKSVMIFPGSGIFGRGKQWIVSAEMVETSRLFARCAGNIDGKWILEIGGDQCKHAYNDPRWDKARGKVMASEQVSLYGLVIVPERPVNYGPVNPKEAREIFIRDALVTGDVDAAFGFLKHNTTLVNELQDLESRFRRRDLVISDKKLCQFYEERLSSVYDISTLRKTVSEAGSDDFLRMNREFLIRYDPAEEEIALFPDTLMLGNNRVECQYRYFPGKPDDGVTIKLPMTVASAIPPDSVDWMVPGLLKEKLTTMIKGLPKKYRKQLVPVSKVVDSLWDSLPKESGKEESLVSSLGQVIYRRFGVDIPAAAWSADELPDHLRMRICITDTNGKEIRSGREKDLLTRDVSRPDDTPEYRSAKRQWEKDNIRRWDFDDLPEAVQVEGKNDVQWVYYPGLEKKDDSSVALRLFPHREKALISHKQGVAALYAIAMAKEFKHLRRTLKLPQDVKEAAGFFGGVKAVEQRIFDSLVSHVFYRNVRTRKEFLDYGESVRPTLFRVVQEKQESAVAVLKQYQETVSTLSRLESVNHANLNASAFLQHLRGELCKLSPANFMELYEPQRLRQLVRYLKAIAIRAQKGVADFERDRLRTRDLKVFTDMLDDLLKGLSQSASEKKRKEIEDFFWLIEEYKVSLFAQELKTAVPVSKKRLDVKAKEIRRMV